MIYKVTLNGKVYEVEVEKGEAVIQAEYEAALPAAAPVAPVAPAPSAPAPAAPAATPAAGSVNSVRSPMPGNINEVRASAGQTVKSGEVIMILEAMKMENEIVAPKAGTITAIHVQKGAVVNTGDPLFDVV